MAVKKKIGFAVSGRRKRAIARATLKPGKGIVRINSMLLQNFGDELARARIMEPIILAGETAKNIDINVFVSGGGCHGQAEAVRLVIGKTLANFDRSLRNIFLEYDRNLLVADIRVKEKRKPNDSKARASRQKSYR